MYDDFSVSGNTRHLIGKLIKIWILDGIWFCCTSVILLIKQKNYLVFNSRAYCFQYYIVTYAPEKTKILKYISVRLFLLKDQSVINKL